MKGNIMNKIINIMISMFIFAFFTSVSFSIDMPKVPGIGKKSGGGDIDVDALADQQSALVKNMTAALANIMTSQIKFAEGLPPYGTGSINMIGAGMESIKLFKSLKGTKDLTIIRKLGNLIYLGKTAPSLISTFSSATSSISAFNSKNGIEEPETFSAAKSAGQDAEL